MLLSALGMLFSGVSLGVPLGGSAGPPATTVQAAGPLSPATGSMGTTFFAELQNFTDVSLAYDAHDGYLLAVAENLSYSGAYGSNIETWAYESGAWVELHPAGSPPARIGSSLTYDPATSSVMLFGGVGPSGFLADTWSYSAGTWTNLTGSSTMAPPPRAGASFAWDANASEGVLYGGIGPSGGNWTNSTTGFVDTWLYSPTGIWTASAQLASSVPVSGGAMTYDPASGMVIDAVAATPAAACGGTDSTWEYASNAWTNISASVSGAPSGRTGGSAAYDASQSGLVLFGGADCHGPRNDTWSFSNGRWTQMSLGTTPSPRTDAQLTFDSAAGELVLFGGFGTAGPQGDTWTLSTSGWALVGPILTFEGAVETGSGVTGDVGTNLTVEVTGALVAGPTDFTYVGLPPECAGPNVAVFRCAGALPGGYNLTGTISSAAGASSTPTVGLYLNAAPEVDAFRFSQTATEIGVAVSISIQASGGTGAYTYSYSGLPPGCASADSPEIVCSPTAEGAYPILGAIVDEVGGTSAINITLVVGPHPFVTGVTLSRSAIDVGQSTVVSISAGGGVGPLTFGFKGLPGGCSSANVSALTCAPTANGTFGITASASDQYGFGASGSAELSVHPQLEAPRLVANESSVELNRSVSFLLGVSGGTLPYAYSFTGLPIGCTSNDSATLTCAPRETGTFQVNATVTDALGEYVTRSATLEVTAVPTSSQPNSTSPGAGNRLDSTLIGGGLIALGAGVAVAAVLVRQGIVRTRRGDELVDDMIRTAGPLGEEYGRIDDPNRRR